ncbi:MAG: FAD-dependent oxidoreductase [Syntrophales bacterium]
MSRKGKAEEVTKTETPTIAPCREACPAGIDVPRYIRCIRSGDFDGALAVIRERIPFPAVCGHACVHPCESACSRIQYDEAIAIRMLKRAAYERSRGELVYQRKAKPTGKKVAIIGSGPCGLTAAHYLAGLGHGVTVFERLPQAGGMLRYGIPEYRLPNGVVDREIAAIQARGVEIVTNAPVRSAGELREKGYDAVLAAAGAWKPAVAGPAGADSPLVMDGLAFLEEVNTGVRHSVGRRVVVVGGGNTAVDAARACVRMGAETLLMYRRGRAEMPAAAEEVAEAEEEGVGLEFMAAPVEAARGRVVCLRMEAGAPDASGRPRPEPIKGSEFALSCDSLIMAVGQRADAASLDLEANPDGTARVGAGLETPVDGIFAAGDVVSGPKTIIEAISQGRTAAASIDRYLGGDGTIDAEQPLAEAAEPPEAAPQGARRPQPERVPPQGRIKGFGLVEFGYDEETASREAGRCLACDIRQYTVEVNPVVCKECGYCMEMCGMEIFAPSESFNAAGFKPAVVKSSERCVGCLKCLYVCPDFAITISEGKPASRPA